MKARLSAVQQALLLLVATASLVAVLVRPQPRNRRVAQALDEIASFRAGFARAKAEKLLRRQAEALTAVPLTAIQRAVTQRGTKLKLSPTAPLLRPLSAVSLALLSEVHAHAQPGTTMPIGLPDVDALGAALAWRLSRVQPAGSYTLTAVQLLVAPVTQADADREREVARLRLLSLDSLALLARATRKLERAEQRVEARKKRKASSLSEYQAILDTVRATFEDERREHEQALAQYEREASSAEHWRTTAQVVPRNSARAIPKLAVARVALALGSEHITFDIPVRLALRDVAGPALRSAGFAGDFPAVRAAALWDQVRDLDAEDASTLVRGHLSWHFKRISLLGIGLSGPMVLQLGPCVLPCLLALLVMCLRRAATGYSPFTTQVPASLPRLGLRYRFVELLAIMVLPMFAVGCAAASLMLVGHLPLMPAVAAIACLTLGSQAFSALQEVKELHTSIAQYHSYPPPAALPVLGELG